MNSKAMAGRSLRVVLVGGFALGLVALTGCGSSSGGTAGGGGGTTGPTGTLAPGGAANIYVIQGASDGPQSILTFPVTSAGSVEPSKTLLPPPALFVFTVATDSAGQIYAGGIRDDGEDEILVYAADATGAATPMRDILVDPASGIVPQAMTVDGSGQIYVAGQGLGNVMVIAAGADGTITPTRLLGSSLIGNAISIAVDAEGKIYLGSLLYPNGAEQGQILVMAAGANGSDAPVQTIVAAAPTSSADTVFYGVAVDATGNIYAVQDTATLDSNGDVVSTSAEVVEFGAGSTGTPTAVKTIGGAATGLSTGGGMRMDGVGNLYVVNAQETSGTATFDVLGFGPAATGNATPGLKFSSSVFTDAGSELAVH